ncbi:unnamed protein product [Amoebophrya sp. A120]|nr:unnamed protein product [Amoebophrya sp. A120]|eukprot:GSA120T00007664001.1
MAASDVCINDHISDVECLNESADFPVRNIFHNSEAPLKSDADHQLLIKIQFRQPVKISGLRFFGVEEESCPTDVKLFVNKPSLGFSEAEDTPTTQDLSLDPAQCNLMEKKDVMCPVKFVKFQSVNALILFVQENNGADITQLKKLEVFGTAAENSDITAWKPCKS